MESLRIQRLADLLYEAERARREIPPLTEQEEAFKVDDAYAVQLYNVERAVAMGQVVCGKKIGLTSPAIQKQLGVDEPDYGHLFASMECLDGAVKTEELIQPKIEAEMAFVLADDLGGGKVTADEVRSATEYVAAAFEIVDSRIADWRIKLTDTIADNASSGRYILGPIRRKLSGLYPPSVEMSLFRNNELVSRGSGAAVQGDPCEAVAWLANRLWNYGVTLKKGEVILSGAFSAAPVAIKGDVFRAEFTELGTVMAEFE